MIIHTVREGDSIQSISRQYNIPVSRLELDNSLPPDHSLNIGQALLISPPAETYIVKEGDTVRGIAREHDIPTLQLLRNNPMLSETNLLTAGDELVIRYELDRTISVMGYTSIFISEQILRRTLPYLSYVIIINYTVNALGGLEDINDERIIRIAIEYGVVPVMFVSSLNEAGRGSYASTHAILNNLNIQNQLIENIINVMGMKGYLALNLSFYNILRDDMPLYVEFVSNVTYRLNLMGYEVFVTLSPHTMGYQADVPYEEPYFRQLGEATNRVILATYLWPYSYMSQVLQTTYQYLRRYVEFAVTQIPPEKIYLGLSRIAYDWELPYVEGETFGTSLTNEAALILANQLGAVIEFEEETQTPYFYYNSAGADHIVWFKDARTNNAILGLVDEYGLAGLAIWNIMYYHPNTWATLNRQYGIQKYMEYEEDLEVPW